MERHMEHKRHSGPFWAYVLIIVGILWLLQRSGWDINLPGLGDFFSGIGSFFGRLFHLAAGVTIPLLVILFGIMLIGRKFFTALLLVLLLMILLPHFLIIPGILMIVFFPIILIIVGIIILSNLF